MDMEISVAKFRWSKYCTLEKDYENSVSVGNIRALRNMQPSEVGKALDRTWEGPGSRPSAAGAMRCARPRSPLCSALSFPGCNSCQLTVWQPYWLHIYTPSVSNTSRSPLKFHRDLLSSSCRAPAKQGEVSSEEDWICTEKVQVALGHCRMRKTQYTPCMKLVNTKQNY